MEYEVTLQRLAYGGEAVGRLADGRAVFVPFALPGEVVKVRLVQEKRSYTRAALLEVLQPSPLRIQARCQHFGECGGCHYQHLPYEQQLQAKTEILREQLERNGGIAQPSISNAVASPAEFNYRNHVQFHLSAGGKPGFQRHAPGSRQAENEVLPIRECHLPQELINQVWPQLDLEAVPSLERIGLRQGAQEDIQLILEGSDALPPEVRVEELPVSVVHLGLAGSLVLAGREYVTMQVLERSFRVSAGSFFQVNTPVAEKMVAALLESLPQMCQLDRNSLVVDAYCGVGLFSAFLRPQAGRLIGIESSPQACQDFALNLDEFDQVELYEAPVELVLQHLADRPELVVLDPPRSGLGKGVVGRLLEMAPPALAYISCDPATLARDARQLAEGGYRLERVMPFDLFPQTYHIESLSWWRR